MGMIPVCAGLLLHGEVVQKRILGDYRALRNERRPICRVRAFLENAMPVLEDTLVSASIICQKTYDARNPLHCAILQFVNDIELKPVALAATDDNPRKCSTG